MRKRRHKILFALLYNFEQEGRREISLSEVLEAIHELQNRTGVGYPFAPRVFYSGKLLRDLDNFASRGYLDCYRYMHDAFVPKTFIKLSLLGRAEGKSSYDQLLDPDKLEVKKYARLAIERYNQRWKIFSRVVAKS
jgi:hypothetical protein